jgi:hypothetical protein
MKVLIFLVIYGIAKTHGQKFETRDIAQAHALENSQSDNNIKLLVIVHKKYNISLPTKYF